MFLSHDEVLGLNGKVCEMMTSHFGTLLGRSALLHFKRHVLSGPDLHLQYGKHEADKLVQESPRARSSEAVARATPQSGRPRLQSCLSRTGALTEPRNVYASGFERGEGAPRMLGTGRARPQWPWQPCDRIF